MKYAILNMDLDEQDNQKAIVNIGSILMRMGIKKLLFDMGIKEEEMIEIPMSALNSYDGEYVIMPINMHWMQDTGNKRLLGMSSRIIPVFLSISLNDTNLSPEQIQYLRHYEPIGCRDDRTMQTLRGYGITSYVFGCIAGILQADNYKNKKTAAKKIFFADVPYGVKDYIPEEFKENIVFVEQELRKECIPQPLSPEEYAKQFIIRYANEARLIVTSRFHGAVLALALGVPVIVVNEAFTFRFSWLKKMVPFYTKEQFKEIDWYPQSVNFHKVRENMIAIARKRILETKERYWIEYAQSEFLELPDQKEYGLIDYYDEAIEFIKRKWKYEESFEYAFWGANNNAEYIYQYIQKHYPNARLRVVYDTFRTLEFHGVTAIKPDQIPYHSSVFVFVTTFVAGYIAKEVFEEAGFDSDNYFICRRRYMTQREL